MNKKFAMAREARMQGKHLAPVWDFGVSLLVLILATLLGYLFYIVGFTEANIITVYILGILILSVITTNRFCSLVASVASVLIFNFFFTVPRFTFRIVDPGYYVTFFIMFFASFLTGTLAIENIKIEKEKEAAAVLAKNEQLRANLLRAISHDLRTPLTSISGNASTLMSNYQMLDDESRTQIFADIYDDSMWLINLVENLLAVTRIEEGKVNFNRTTELMDEVIAEALKHVDRKSKDHIIRVHSEREFILAQIDAKLIVQVLINIVDNAIKYTPRGSLIEIDTRSKGSLVEVSVSDNGPGIPDEHKKHVFDMFYSGANQVADSRRSLGLGLSLCKSIITAHGGTIEVKDHQPKGTTFTFTLPAGEVEIHE